MTGITTLPRNGNIIAFTSSSRPCLLSVNRFSSRKRNIFFVVIDRCKGNNTISFVPFINIRSVSDVFGDCNFPQTLEIYKSCQKRLMERLDPSITFHEQRKLPYTTQMPNDTGLPLLNLLRNNNRSLGHAHFIILVQKVVIPVLAWYSLAERL